MFKSHLEHIIELQFENGQHKTYCIMGYDIFLDDTQGFEFIPWTGFPMLNTLLQATVPETSLQISSIIFKSWTSKHLQNWPLPSADNWSRELLPVTTAIPTLQILAITLVWFHPSLQSLAH